MGAQDGERMVRDRGLEGCKAGNGEVQDAGTCWRTASLRGASTSSAPAWSMLLREAAPGKGVGARAGVLRGRKGGSRDRAGSRVGSDSSRAARAALTSAGRGDGMRQRPWAVPRGRWRKRGARPGGEHDEIAA